MRINYACCFEEKYYFFVYIAWFFYSTFEMGWVYYLTGPSFFNSFRFFTIFCKTVYAVI